MNIRALWLALPLLGFAAFALNQRSAMTLQDVIARLDARLSAQPEDNVRPVPCGQRQLATYEKCFAYNGKVADLERTLRGDDLVLDNRTGWRTNSGVTSASFAVADSPRTTLVVSYRPFAVDPAGRVKGYSANILVALYDEDE